MVLAKWEFSLPHNPSVSDSNPACPTPFTHPLEAISSLRVTSLKSLFFAKITHSTGNNRLYPEHSLFFKNLIAKTHQVFLQLLKFCVFSYRKCALCLVNNELYPPIQNRLTEIFFFNRVLLKPKF